jgi:hypothetical protein
MKKYYQIPERKDEILYHLPEWVRKLKQYFSKKQDERTVTDYQRSQKEQREDA